MPTPEPALSALAAPVLTASALAEGFDRQSVEQRLGALRQAIAGRLVFTTSLGIEDQVITHHIAASGIDIELVTLDTGRLFPETYDLWALTQQRYNITIRGINPDTAALQQLTAEHGINCFYESPGKRHACCAIRKLEPLNRALQGAAGWVTGLRAGASDNRAALAPVTFDNSRGLIKFSPLFDWSRTRVANYAASNDVPVNPLHDRGFVSIGCAPCTRAIADGEPERAGRWWWEQEGNAECGLHVGEGGRLVRAHS